MTQPSRNKSEVRFSAAQLRYLTEQFPQVVLGPSTPEEALRYYFGQQSVIEAVRRKTSTSDA